MWLFKCLKRLVSEHQVTDSMINSLKKRTEAFPTYCFITLTKIVFENIRCSVSEIVGVFVNTLTAD